MQNPAPARRRRRGLHALAQPWVVWLLTAVLAARFAIDNLVATDRPDADAFMQAGSNYIHHPAQLYADQAAYLARTGFIPLHGLLGPPFGAVIAAPFSTLPAGIAVGAFTAVDALCALLALILLDRTLRPTGSVRALYWLIAAYFPPLFADVDAGQFGGYLLLFGVLGIIWVQRRPIASGIATSAGIVLKLYPAAMVLGAGPRRLRRWLPAAMLGSAILGVLCFAPLGTSGVSDYVSGVLLPSLRSPHPDCAMTPVETLFTRAFGGEPWPVVSGGTLQFYTSPLHALLAAQVTADIVLVLIVVAMIWSAWRSGWHPLYGMAFAFSLGGLIPGELNPYQLLPLLPVMLIVAVRCANAGHGRTLLALGIGLLGFIRQPCELVFPNIWTIAALIVFAVCCWSAPLFRDAEPAAAT